MSKLFGGLIGKLGLLVGAGMIAGGIYFSVTKKDDFGEGFKRPPHVIEISNENYSVPVKDEFQRSMQEKFKITVELDEKNNVLYLGNYTQDYNKKDWSGTEKELLPTNHRHIGINHLYSKTFILHPPEVKITNQEQIAFLIPNYSWDENLTPYEEHKEAQMAIEGGEKIIDWALGKIPIPFFQDFIKQGFENATKKEKEYYDTLFEKIREGYTGTIIPSQIPNKILGYTETARESKISFDAGKLEEPTKIYLWTKIALGNPTISADNSFPNKYGELENIVIEFKLEREKEMEIVEEVEEVINNIKLEDCFLNEKELERVTLSTTNNYFRSDEFETNPHIRTEDFGKVGVASYRFWNSPLKVNRIHLAVIYTNVVEDGMEYATNELYFETNPLFEHTFLIDNRIISSIYAGRIDVYDQIIPYIDILLNYQKRLNAKLIFKSDEFDHAGINEKEYFKLLKELKQRYEKFYSENPNPFDHLTFINPESVETLKSSLERIKKIDP